jgi:hypothetical protein
MDLTYTIASNMILQFMKDAENKALDMTGAEKKSFVIEMIKKNLPQIYQDHSLLIDVTIDALVLVSNNPTLLKAQKECFLNCLKCCK